MQHVSALAMQLSPHKKNPALQYPARLSRGEITDCSCGTALWNIRESLMTVPFMTFERKFMKRGTSAKAGGLQRMHATTSTTTWKVFMVAHLKGVRACPAGQEGGFYIVLELK